MLIKISVIVAVLCQLNHAVGRVQQAVLVKISLFCGLRLVSGSGDIKLTKDGNVLLHEMVRIVSYLLCAVTYNCILSGMGSSRTVVVLEDTLRTQFCGFDLSFEVAKLLALALKAAGFGLVFEAPFAAKYCVVFFLTLTLQYCTAFSCSTNFFASLFA